MVILEGGGGTDEEELCILVGWYSKFNDTAKQSETSDLIKLQFIILLRYHIWRVDQNVLLRNASAHPSRSIDRASGKIRRFHTKSSQNAKAGLDLLGPWCHNSHLSNLQCLRILILSLLKLSPQFVRFWGLCVLQSCVWPTLPSHRTRVSLTSATLPEILGRPASEFIPHDLNWFSFYVQLSLLSGRPKTKIISCLFNYVWERTPIRLVKMSAFCW